MTVQTFVSHVPRLTGIAVGTLGLALLFNHLNFTKLVRQDVVEMREPWGWSIPFKAVVLYVGMLAAGTPDTPWRGARCTQVMRMWNLGLCVLSGLMFWGMLMPFVQLPRHDLICMFPERWDIPTTSGYWFSHVFLYSKILELGDTVWLRLRGKSVSFLHVYHHISVLLFCWHCVYERFWPGVYFSTLNSAVHFIMYHYYFAATFGRVGYARYLTVMQTTQMIIGLAITFAWTVRHWLDPETCPVPSSYSIPFAVLIYGSYLGLFLQYYCRRYGTPKKKTRRPPVEP